MCVCVCVGGGGGVSVTNLQWTVSGPWLTSTNVRTVLTKSIAAIGVSGTPWSGHEVNWKCRTNLDLLSAWRQRINEV